MSVILDRRLNGKNKSAVNRQRFIKRFNKQIKEAVSNAIAGRSITDIENGETINIPAKDLSEPIFQHDRGGVRETVHPGNREFKTGDKIERPPQQQGQGQGSQASDQGEGMDDFGFEISREEFLELFFEDLALPNLIQHEVKQVESYQWIRAGVSKDGVPSNINIVRSMKSALGRRTALSGAYRKKLKELEKEYLELQKNTIDDDPKLLSLAEEIAKLKSRIKRVPFIDTIDLRYNNRIKQVTPSTQAVMFCIMDVSGSMDEAKKDIAKRFFILLYLFLTRNYEKIDVVFIRHHTSAKEVDEQEFFYSRETGGTVVSSALELMKQIMDERYPTTDWNIYGAQASDGDNWNNDSPLCRDLMQEQIMPFVQYFSYVEIMPRHHQSLWEAYLSVQEAYNHFNMQHIENVGDIYPIFRSLFKRESA